jgi:hypothetical protein
MVQETYSRRLRALRLSDHEVVVVVSVAEFLELTVPARAFLARASNDPLTRRMVDEMSDLHDLIQRDLAGQKLRNARTDLARYVRDEWVPANDGPGSGVMGPFIVLTPHEIAVEDDAVQLRAGQKFIIEDGESRGESFLWLLDQPDLDPDLAAALLEKQVTMVIHHGIPVATAAKWFADINGKGIGVNANLIVARDFTDPYRDAAERVFARLGVPLERSARQVRATSAEVFTVLQARLAVTALAKGPAAVAYGASRIPPNGTDFAQLEDGAVEWFKHVFNTLGIASFKDKARVLRSVPVLVAVGSLGRPYYDGADADRRAARRIIRDQAIDWTVGPHWSGICGKVNPNTGVFSVGSAKEYGNAAFNALTKVGSDPYRQIRGEAVVQAA